MTLSRRTTLFLIITVAILSSALARAEDKVGRGKYLVTTSGCHDCHTPAKMGPNGPEPDMSRALSGHPENIKVAVDGEIFWCVPPITFRVAPQPLMLMAPAPANQ